jgi:hypothetical protein
MTEANETTAKTEATEKKPVERKNIEVELHQIGSVLVGRILHMHPGLRDHIINTGMTARVGATTFGFNASSGDGPALPTGNSGLILIVRNIAYPQHDYRWFTYAYKTEELANEVAACMLKGFDAMNALPLAKMNLTAKPTSVRKLA